MPILIDYQRCDGSPDCPSARWCASGALTYDSDQRKVVYNQELCTSCGTCANWCGPAAIYLAETNEDLEFLKEELARIDSGGQAAV